MARYIDADKIRYSTEIIADESGSMAEFDVAYKEDIDSQPTADVAPVVHAHWWLEREPDGKPYCFHCSHCDADGHYIGDKVATDYCPQCGALMGEELTYD